MRRVEDVQWRAVPRVVWVMNEGTGIPGPLSLPPRVDALITGAHVITMDPALGELAGADVRIRDGVIVGVGHGLRGGEVISGAGMALLPGLVDTHWHLWNTLLRGTIGDRPGRDYFTVKRALAPHYRVEDFYWAARLALAEAALAVALRRGDGPGWVGEGAASATWPSAA